MKFKLHQIIMSRELAQKVNAGEDVPAFNHYQKALHGDFTGVDKAFYEHVSDIEAADLNEVFHIGNMGPEDKISRHKPMRSVSVGDIIEDASGNLFFVDNLGFKNVKDVEDNCDEATSNPTEVNQNKMSV